MRFLSAFLGALFVVLFQGFQVPTALALELDWSGQFRAEHHYISGYNNGAGFGTPVNPFDPASTGATPGTESGYTTRDGGASTAQFQTLFLRLRPKLVVNDNVYLKSEWWAGDPVFGFFGNSAPYSFDQRQFYSSQSRGSIITMQRFWAEILSDIGTFQVGRAPLHWGLGILWNSGDGNWDRYQSTGDVIRVISKFGSFTFTPSIIKYSMGNSVGGSCDSSTALCSTISGRANVSDYSLILKYENLDEELEGGINFVRRVIDAGQDAGSGYFGLDTKGTQRGGGFNTYDIYARKKTGKLTLAAEAPIVEGTISGLGYSAYALAGEASYQANSTVGVSLKAGRAPGQPSSAAGPSNFQAYFFNPNYRLGMIMFGYQLANLSGANSSNSTTTSAANLRSPFDNPIVNANYLAASTTLSFDKWRFRPGVVMAAANQTAAAGQNFYHYWLRTFVPNNSGKDQPKYLGTEFDLGIDYIMDDHFQFNLDMGLFSPGGFYSFSNSAAGDNNSPSVFAAAFRVGLNF